MSEWKTYRLEEVTNYVNRGVTPSYSDEGVIVINQKCIRDGKVTFEQSRFTNSEKKKIAEEKYLQSFDILINSTGQGTLGRVGQTKQIEQPTTVDSHVTIVRANNNIHPIYLGYSLKSKQSLIESLAEGSTGQTELSRYKVADIEIQIPNLPTQKEIAQILTSLDDKIELNLQMNQTLEDMAQAIFKEWFVNFNFPGFDGELVDGLPKGWIMGKVSDVCKVNTNTLSSRDQIETIQYIEISEVQRGIVNNISRYVRGEEPSRAKRKLVHGDVALSTVRPNRGSYFLALFPEEDLIASTGFAVFSAESVPYSFLYCFLTSESQIDFYGKMADGAAYPAINQSVIMDMDLIIPSKDILKMYDDFAQTAYLRIHFNLKENQTLTQTRDTLLPKLMSGQLEVSEP
ncbi:MAG: restriction endonuclease subunit S [Fulvivirga sp.]